MTLLALMVLIMNWALVTGNAMGDGTPPPGEASLHPSQLLLPGARVFPSSSSIVVWMFLLCPSVSVANRWCHKAI